MEIWVLHNYIFSTNLNSSAHIICKMSIVKTLQKTKAFSSTYLLYYLNEYRNRLRQIIKRYTKRAYNDYLLEIKISVESESCIQSKGKSTRIPGKMCFNGKTVLDQQRMLSKAEYLKNVYFFD